MDIDLLSKMVKELILDNDRVVLPGLGYFAAEIVPSTFSDRGYTINPPYRKLYFRQDSGRDGLLARLYAESNGTGTDVAEHIIEDFVRDMRAVLDKEKVMIFPGLGRLRATRENNYFFVPDEDMDIFPEGAGLEPVSLKTHSVRNVSAGQENEPLSDAGHYAMPGMGISTEPEVGPGVPSPEAGPMPGNEEQERFPVHETVEDPGAAKQLETESSDGPGAEQVPEHKGESEQNPSQELSTGSVAVMEHVSASEPASGTDLMTVPSVEPVQESEALPAAVQESGLPQPDPQPEPLSDQRLEPQPQPENVQPAAEQPESPAEKEALTRTEGKARTVRVILLTAALLVALAVIALGVFVLLADLCPDFINSILYSPEELEILNY